MFCFVGGKEGICRTWLSSLRKLELVEDRIPMIYDRNDNVYIIYIIHISIYIYICITIQQSTIKQVVLLPLMICPPEFWGVWKPSPRRGPWATWMQYFYVFICPKFKTPRAGMILLQSSSHACSSMIVAWFWTLNMIESSFWMDVSSCLFFVDNTSPILMDKNKSLIRVAVRGEENNMICGESIITSLFRLG